MTAPPWSVAAPPQPPAPPVDADPGDDAEPPYAEEPDGPVDAFSVPPAPVVPPPPGRREAPAARLDAPAAPPPPNPFVEPAPVHGDHPEAAAEQRQAAQGWSAREDWRSGEGYPSPQEAWQTTDEEKGRGRTTMVVAAVVALVVLAIMVGVAVLVFGGDAAPPPEAAPASPSAAAKPSGPPPGELKLRDDGGTIALTWTDPSSGAVPFMVAGGRTGQKLGVMATVDPGQTSYTVNGLNARVDYCFTVLAVYSTDAFATSGQVCTERGAGATPG
ncbi:fibronectin type III domain-containing protein [Micromonospora okii]|uniref:fibronectin type III domain-containing protein n=1 Tax=Micromonospora okii TaxID=1182970 RepID=UPI001E2DA007|nr:fibronectin type III domain-containing protein [Micromonospora okii]